MKLSASQAAKMVGKSVPTISRAIKSGKLSGKKLKGGGYEIEISELERVWPLLQNETPETPTMSGHETPNVTSELQVQIDLLSEQLAHAKTQLENTKTERDDWKEQSAKWERQADAVTRLIEDHSEKKSLIKRIFG